jgi:ribosomal protein L7/L12
MTRVNKVDSIATELREIKRRLHALETSIGVAAARAAATAAAGAAAAAVAPGGEAEIGSDQETGPTSEGPAP